MVMLLQLLSSLNRDVCMFVWWYILHKLRFDNWLHDHLVFMHKSWQCSVMQFPNVGKCGIEYIIGKIILRLTNISLHYDIPLTKWQ